MSTVSTGSMRRRNASSRRDHLCCQMTTTSSRHIESLTWNYLSMFYHDSVINKPDLQSDRSCSVDKLHILGLYAQKLLDVKRPEGMRSTQGILVG